MSVPESAQRIATKVTKVTSRAQASHEESEGVGNKEVNVFGDALVGIVGFSRHELHPIVGTVGQPSAEVTFGKPAPPADLEHLVKVKLVDGEQDDKGPQASRRGSAVGERLFGFCSAGR